MLPQLKVQPAIKKWLLWVEIVILICPKLVPIEVLMVSEWN